MFQKRIAIVALVLSSVGGSCPAAEVAKEIAVGEWSKPVADSRGFALRGRLVLCEKPRDDDIREVVVYVDVQDASDVRGDTLWLFCELAKKDFRPEHKGGLQAELRSKDGQLVKPTSYPFSGGMPKSQWVTLPTDGTIRLRTTPFGIRRKEALAISPDLGTLWVIANDDPGEYFLSGTFTIGPVGIAMPLASGHVWRGVLELPAVRVTSRRE